MLENSSIPKRLIRGKWYIFNIDFRNYKIPEKIKLGGNYAIFIDGKLRYIGESKNLAKRLNQHIPILRNFLPEYLKVKIKIRPEKKSERYRIEHNLILKLKPPGNYNNIKIMKDNIFEKFENLEINGNKNSGNLREYGLSNRTVNALNRGGIETLEELKNYIDSYNSLEYLYLIENFGLKCMEEIKKLFLDINDEHLSKL